MNDMAQSRFADCENKLLEVDSIARTTGSVEMKLSTARQLYQFYKKREIMIRPIDICLSFIRFVTRFMENRRYILLPISS